MIRFKNRPKNQKLFLFVTALDQTVIARPNFRFDEECWEKLPEFAAESGMQPRALLDTPVYEHIRALLQLEKYEFLWKNRDEYDQILEQMVHLQLPDVLWQEISWLHRFGYYYHHALAIMALVSRFALDVHMASEKLLLALKAALLSDIGISRLPNAILFSSHLFTDDEKMMMQQHPMISYLLTGYYFHGRNRELGLSIFYHHEPDIIPRGNGAVNMDRVREISWMLYNFDVFDALISNRPFRPAYHPENAILYLKQINRSFSLPLDIIFWLEKRFGITGIMTDDPLLIPIHPSIKAHQLN